MAWIKIEIFFKLVTVFLKAGNFLFNLAVKLIGELTESAVNTYDL